MWYLLFGVFTVVAASGGHSGECPALKPVENFNLTAYFGKWYEISKYPAENQGPGTCPQTEYTPDGDVVKVKNANIVNGVQKTVEGTAKLQADGNNAGIILCSLNVKDAVRESTMYILAIDYSSYAVVYSCRFDPKTNTHRDFLWILSRTKVLEGEAKTAVDNVFANIKELDTSKLVPNDLSEEACKFTSTTSLFN